MISKIFQFASSSDFIQNIVRDLKSLRALWNYIYLALYTFLCVWAALHHPESLSVAIMTTGTIVTAIFTGYVFTSTYERVQTMRQSSAIAGAQKPAQGSKNVVDDSAGAA